MDNDELLSIMADWNFWGNFRRSWIEREDYVNRILRLLEGVNIIAISGIRRSGKSFIAFQCVKKLIERGVNPKDTLIVKLDDERLIDVDYNTLLRIIDLYIKNVKENRNTPSYIVIDEAQEVDGWERIVRGLAEGNKVIVTGSSAKLLSSEFTSLLSGRHVEVRVFPLNLRES